MKKISTHTTVRFLSLMAALSALAVAGLQAQVPTDNPVATHYGPGNYPLWTQDIRWDNVINMAEYSNGANHFERFENARDELYAQGGGVLYYPAGEYFFDLPDVGWGAGNGTTSRGLMLKSGVVIRGANLVAGSDQAVIRESQEVDTAGFARVIYNLQPQTVFRFPMHRRGTDPVTGEPNSAGYVPSHWSFIGMVPSADEETVADVNTIGVVNVKLDAGFIFWGFHTPRAQTASQGRWLQNFKDNWPEGAAFEQTWAGRAPDGTHYMDAINGGENWHTPVSAGSGRLIFGVYSINGAPFDDMTRLDVNTAAFGVPTALPADAFHSYRFTGRFTAHGSNIFIGNNVLAKPTLNFVHRMLQNAGERNVLFDFSNHIGVDVNKSNFGGRQRDPSVTGFDTGYHFPNVIVRDNWIFNRGNKGMDIAAQYLVIYNNHNERYHIARRFPINYITNPEVYIAAGATQTTGIDAGGVSFDGWRWQSSTSASDFMSRGYDIGGRNVWAHRNSVINTGSIGNDGEGIMAQYHNHVAVLSWAFTENHQNQFDLGPGTFGEPGWIGVYDMHTIGFFHWRNFGPGQSGYLLAAHRPDALNVMLDAFIGPNLGTGSQSAPVTRTVGGVQVQALRYTDYQTLHTDPVNAPINVRGTPLPDGNGIVIQWEDASDNELGFRVERRFPGQPWQTIAYRPPVKGTRIHGVNDVFYQETNPAAGYSGPVVAIPFDYPEVNPTRWTDFTARPDMGPEYRVVAINGLDDDSTGVSAIFFADPDSLKLDVAQAINGVVTVTDNFATTGIDLTAQTLDGDGTAVGFQWQLLNAPSGGVVTFANPTEATTNVIFSAAGVYRLQVRASDETYSPALAFTVNVGQPVVFTEQPESQSVLVGNSVTFSVGIGGSGPFSYQWLRNGTPIAGANEASFTLAELVLAESGSYSVAVTSPLGTFTSNAAVLTVESAPTFLTQPLNRTAAVGTAITFSVDVAAEPSPTFQWFFEGEPIFGQTGATLTVFPVLESSAGAYTVAVTNIHGTNTATAQLSVIEADRFLINFSRQEFTSDGVNAWQTVALNRTDQNSAPNVFSHLPLRNFNGDDSKGINMTQTSTVEGNNVGFLSDIAASVFTGNVPAWFNPSLEPLRQSFGFNSFNNWFEFTFDGFHPEDVVTFEFVMARAGTGERPISLVLNPGTATERVLLNAVSTNLTPSYPKTTVTGAESYTFRIINNRNNTWSGLLNAMAIDVEYFFEEPTAPIVTVSEPNVRAEVRHGALLTVEVAGVGPFAYQWFRNGEAIAGATEPVLQLENLGFQDAATFTVAVTNALGTTVSDPMELRVVQLSRVNAFLETFDAGTEEAPRTLADINWNVHHSFAGHSLVGRDIGLMEADGTVSEWIFNPILLRQKGDFRFGSELGFVTIFMDSRPNYGSAGTRLGVAWPDAAQPGPHPETGSALNNRILSLLLWTDAGVNIEGEARANLEEFSFVQGMRDASVQSFMPAVRIGNEWFVYHVSQEYLRDNVRPRQLLAGQNPATAAEVNAETVFRDDEFFTDDYETETRAFRSHLYRFAWREHGWTRLVFDGTSGVDSTVGMTLGDVLEGTLPDGAIEAIGVFSPENITAAPLNGFRVDSIRLVTLEEVPMDEVKPILLSQPSSVAVNLGSPFALSVEFIEPTGEVAIQWFKDGVAIDGAMDSVLAINSVQLVDAGAYSVVLTNAAGTTTSAAAIVTVLFDFDVPFIDPVQFGPAGGVGEIGVTTADLYSYLVSSDADWLEIVGGPQFTGENLIEFSVAPNTSGQRRSARVTVDGTHYAVVQEANVIDFFPGAQPANPEVPGTLQLDWLGWVYAISDEGFVWMWTPAHGWWAAMPAGAGDESAAYFLWDATVDDWWYAVPAVYPWLYAFNVNGAASHGWLFFIEETSDPRLFYSANKADFLTELELYAQP